ncbi:MAG: hypothetical protein ACFE85_18300 [Candidatus Hodarchaeota archaeon]
MKDIRKKSLVIIFEFKATLAMEHGLPIDDIAHTVHSHPTLSEMVLETAEAFMGRAIHTKGHPVGPKLRDILLEQFP